MRRLHTFRVVGQPGPAARRPKPGLFEAASGGTLFLDEIEALLLLLQSKLLKAIEEKRVRRLGAAAPRRLSREAEARCGSGRIADAVPLLTQAMEQTMATNLVTLQSLCSFLLGEAQMLAGNLAEAPALAAGTLALAQEHQEHGRRAYALSLLGEVAVRRESPNVDPAENHYRQALSLANDLGMRPLQARCHRALRSPP